MTENIKESEDQFEESHKLYADYRKDLLARQLSNSENFDRSILSLSSAILAVSVAFVRGQPQLPPPQFPALLWLSWVSFALAIIFTVISFMTSQAAIDRHLEFAAQYYLEQQENALGKSSAFASTTKWLARLSGVAFVAGVMLTISFATLNLPRGDKMSKKSTGSPTFRVGGAPVPKMQPSGVGSAQKGAPIPAMQPVGGTNPSGNGSQAGSQGSGQQGSSGKSG
jgi:hypothetical protein